MSLWLIEGLPGAGKSTTANFLCTLARESGYDAEWYLEEFSEHPVHPRWLIAQRHTCENLAEVFLQSWSRFAERCKEDGVVHILEGSAFQSTVRFMMEERQSGIRNYYRRFEEIVAPLNPRMVYLRPPDPLYHSRWVAGLRGKNWTEKISSYLEKTSYSLHERLTGLGGMHRFWTDYAALCDELTACTKIPTKAVEIVPGNWKHRISEAAVFCGL